MEQSRPRLWRPVALVLPLLVIGAVTAIVALAARSPVGAPTREAGAEVSRLAPGVSKLDAEFQRIWRENSIDPAPDAPDLDVLRRLSLALHGTVPSLEEIRSFEADQRSDRLDHWTRRMLADPRFNDYFAERLARSLVGTDGGQFVIFRRDRFVRWLSEQLKKDAPWDETVRLMVSQEGLWTDRPAVNFVAQAVDDGKIDYNRLAGRAARAFLGQRIDCAQCHNHPFADWKQHDFEGLASYFGLAHLTITGIEDLEQVDGRAVEFVVQDRETLKHRIVAPKVPFSSEWLPQDGSRRAKLAAWITHPDNRRFERAIANRVWGILFGRAQVEPVDDIPNPAEKPDVLDILGRDFREHNGSIKRLVQVIAASQPFRRASAPSTATRNKAQDTEDLSRLIVQAECYNAQFPLIRLRPEQVIGSMLQSSSAQTADQNSHALFRILRLTRENDFVKEYGDLGEDELDDRGGTIPQRLMMMNGKLTMDVLEPNLFNATARLAALASTDEKCIEAAYLMCLTRRPSPEEVEHFRTQLAGKRGRERGVAVEDLVWTLFNSTEFSWNH